MKVLSCVLITSVLTFAMPALSMQLAGDEVGVGVNAGSIDSQSRVFRASLVSYGFDRLLKTDNGEFQLPTSTQVIDQRKDKGKPAHVTLEFQGAAIRRVTIYQ